jgi:hypothetical protein
VAAGHIEASEKSHLLREVNENIKILNLGKINSWNSFLRLVSLVSDEIMPTKS